MQVQVQVQVENARVCGGRGHVVEGFSDLCVTNAKRLSK
jgi:hypothetical protein